MRVLAWLPQTLDTSPGQRFRIEQWEPFLRRAGLELHFSPFVHQRLLATLQRRGRLLTKTRGVLGALAARVREARCSGSYAAAYVFREGALLGPALAERLLAWSRLPFVFDFDDAVWVRYRSPSNSYFSYLRFPGKTATLCRLARHVLAGNSYLADYARRHNPNVTIVPTTIDTEVYKPPPAHVASCPVIGWTGSFSTVPYLGLVKPVLERLRRRLNFRCVVVGGEGFSAAGVEVEQRPWRSASEVHDLSDFDIGIMPLFDSEWERGKCGLKALQYMALGIATVVSPVGVNRHIVAHGQNGLLASTEADWERALENLLLDPALRARLGTAGRATVVAEYSAAVHAPRVARILREVAIHGSGSLQ